MHRAALDDNFSTLFDFLPIGAYRSSPDGHQLRANLALARLNGYADEAAQLASVGDIATEWYVEPQRRQDFIEALERDGHVRGFVSEVYRHKTRERIWVSENAHRVRDSAGRALYYEGTVEDITDRVRAEHALRDSEGRLTLALDSTGDGVWDWDLVADKGVFSPRFMQMYGFAADECEAMSRTIEARTHPEDVPAMRRARDEHFAGRSARYVNEHRVQCKDGQWKWILSRGLVIRRDAEGRPLRIIGTHTDITEARQAEALRRARDAAEMASQAKTTLLSNVSHELRTPLNGVLGFAQLLEHAKDLPAQYRPWVAQILASGRHLVGVVDDLLDLSSAQAGGLRMTLDAVDPVDVLLASWAMLDSRAQRAGIAFIPRLQRSPGLQVRADRRRLTQVLTNLLSNAIKYNRPGGRVEVSCERVGEHVEIGVADSGLGMDSAQLERIFQPFERLGAEASAVEGTGLGLALSRQLVLAMQGEIRVASQRERGTTFTVVLNASG